MRRLPVVLLAFAVLAPGSARRPPGAKPRLRASVDTAELARLVDSVMRVGMAEERIPGAAVLVLDGGRVVLERGYGVADVAGARPVDPRRTLWPFASVTKVVTATALMQLVERGRVDLDADVNRYLQIARVPPCSCGAVTARHLLTHTDLLDELPGRLVESRAQRQPLAQFLRTRLVRAGAPGSTTRYGSYGIMLAGVVIEDVSGLSYPEYLRREVFAPLGMRRTSIDVAPGQEAALATPYERAGDSVRVAAYEWYNSTPTSSLVSTVDDMGRFVAMHLGAEPPAGSPRVLSRATIRDMAAQHASVHPDVPGWGYGWQRNDANGQDVLEHGGDIGGFASLVTLLPDRGFAIIVVHHLEGSELRFKLKRAILDRFFPDRRTPLRPLAALPELRPFAGTYVSGIYCHTCPGAAERAPRFEVTVQPDGSLELWDAKWRPAGPLLFVDEGGRRRIGFARDSTGAVTAVSGGSWKVLERAPAGLGPPR
ncbi:MAG TPA: serine hydrolase domain-containing protein [Longimicrobiaceae bacterium]